MIFNFPSPILSSYSCICSLVNLSFPLKLRPSRFSRLASAKADISLNPFKISWKGTYNLTRSTNIGSDNEYINGKQLRYTPLNRIKQYLQVKYNQYSLSGSWNYTGTRYTTRDHSGFELNPYSIYNLFLSRKLSFNQFSANVQLKIKNVFDEQYQVVRGYPMPGRAFYIKLNVKFNK